MADLMVVEWGNVMVVKTDDGRVEMKELSTEQM